MPAQQQHVQHHNNNNHHDQHKQQSHQAAPAANNQQWQSQTAAGNWQTGQQASNANGNYQANGYQATNTYQAPAYGLSCWKCNADSFDLCEKRGYEEKCQPNQEVCELEIRIVFKINSTFKINDFKFLIIHVNEMHFENGFQRENGIHLPNPYGMQVS